MFKMKIMFMNRNKEILDNITRQLMQTLPKDGHAVLYGSQARGDSHEGSDWDILILLDQQHVSLKENTAITYPLVSLGWEMDAEINPVVYTVSEWNKYKGTPFYDNVLHDGIAIA